MSERDNNKERKGPMGGPPPGMGRPGEKPKDFKKSIGKLFSHNKTYLPFIIGALILAAVGTVLNVVGPNKIKDITNLIQEGLMTGIDLKAVQNIAILLVVLYTLSFIFNYIQGFIMATVTQRMCQGLRTDISHKINRLPLKYFDKTTFGNVLSRVTNDVDTIGHTMNQSIGSLVTAVTMLIGSLIMMFITNCIMAFAAIASTFIGFFMMSFIIKKSQKYFVSQQRELGIINGHIEESYSGHNVIKAYNAEKVSKKTFHSINNKLYNSAWKSQFMSGIMMPLMVFIGNFGYVVVCIVGAALVINNKASIGVIAAFIIYIRLFTNPLSQIAQAATSLQSAAAASERVFEFLDEKEMDNEDSKVEILKNVRGNIEFQNVRFGYDESRIIINDFSAKVKAGQKVAIVGPTGAGKTTMVNLLMRFYELNSGKILIDGIDAASLKRENIHDLFCMVLQDTWLFEGTIKENIVYSKKGISDDDVVKACKAAGVHHFIQTLPEGYNTVLNENASLSAGQKQLITIARALIEDAPLLILDEATSSVDTRTEVLIQKAMDQLMKGRTSFVIAHRLSTIKNADIILVMKEGDILESGNHEALLEKNGFYAELYNSQFETV